MNFQIVINVTIIVGVITRMELKKKPLSNFVTQHIVMELQTWLHCSIWSIFLKICVSSNYIHNTSNVIENQNTSKHFQIKEQMLHSSVHHITTHPYSSVPFCILILDATLAFTKFIYVESWTNTRTFKMY
jgi:hypothetical protein